MVNESRALTARIVSRISSEPVDGAVARARVHAVKCVATFPHALKYHLTFDGFCSDLRLTMEMSDARINAAKAVALRKELSSIWGYNCPFEKAFVDRLLDPGIGNRPMHVLHEINAINSQVFGKPKAEGGAGLGEVEKNEVDRSLTRFQDVLGGCERIYKTPVFTEYSRFTSRVTWMYCNLLPFALYP